MGSEKIVDTIRKNRVRIGNIQTDREADRWCCLVNVRCFGEVVEKEVEKLLRGGSHAAVVTVRAEVCKLSGERFNSKETISRLLKNFFIKCVVISSILW